MEPGFVHVRQAYNLLSYSTNLSAPSQCKVDPMQCYPPYPNQNPGAKKAIKIPPYPCSNFHNSLGILLKSDHYWVCVAGLETVARLTLLGLAPTLSNRALHDLSSCFLIHLLVCFLSLVSPHCSFHSEYADSPAVQWKQQASLRPGACAPAFSLGS